MLELVRAAFATPCASFPKSAAKPSKWGQFQPLAKSCVIAALRAVPELSDEEKAGTAVVLLGEEGSSETNCEYFSDWLANGRQLGSGLLFRYTLPSSAPAEAAIALKLRGPLFFLQSRYSEYAQRLEELDALCSAENLSGLLLFLQEPNGVTALFYRFRPPFQRCARTLPRIAAAIPAYNHAGQLPQIVAELSTRIPYIVVIDDGSVPPIALDGVTVLRHDRNLGKGAALQTAFTHLRSLGFDWCITLDADGQHLPEDAPLFFDAIFRDPTPAVWLGVRNLPETAPRSSRFGRAFSNFWVRLETGLALRDTQTGFRAWPLSLPIEAKSKRFDFEIEALVRLAWGGVPVRELSGAANYPADRTSRFDPWRDNLRLSALHAKLLLLRLLPIPHKRLVPAPKKPKLLDILKDGIAGHSTPGELSLAAFLGILLGALPIPGVHIALVVYFAARFRLNQSVAFAAQSICTPPFVPVACIELGHLLLRGTFLTDLSWTKTPSAYAIRYGEWWLGAILLGPILGVFCATLVWTCAKLLRRKR